MRLMYTKPKLIDLSQGSRIAFARQFRLLSQDNVSDQLGLTGECKRRTMTRYEKGNRHPKNDRTLEIAKILNVNVNAIKQYEYKEPIDVIYMLMWLEELIPNYHIDLSDIPSVNNKTLSDIELNEFLEYNVNKVIEYYDDFKEEKHGIKKDSKRYLAKQIKQRI